MTEAMPQSAWENVADLMETTDSNMRAVAAITLITLDDVTPELWVDIQKVMGNSGELLGVLKEMLTMGSKMMSNEALAEHALTVALAAD